ncbi:hypothetical protein GGH99_004015, partial [Coemansia sp. RSA 1285]
MTNSIDFQNLLKRIEKATARLEEVANRRSEQRTQSQSSAAAGDSGSVLADDAGADSKAVTEYLAMVKPLVQKYVECSSKIGGVVGEQAHKVETLFRAQ